ncbi:hypothetical protein [Paraglaciecola sp.]|uniref:hypothetical protein n=1 Tax=Paraglaciecola sp. TaxID=1920173 RepID=UPI0030F41A61
MAYKWQKNYACTTVFAVFRSKSMLDQQTVPSAFDQAGNTKLGTLTYFPRTNTDATLLDNQATMMANMFVNHMANLGVINEMEEEGTTKHDVKQKLKDIFKDGSKTLKDVAETIDKMIKFFDEE